MNYPHPILKVDEPAPGYIVITGHAPKAFFIENVGHVVPPDYCIIPPEIPASLLRAIADARSADYLIPEADVAKIRELKAAAATVPADGASGSNADDGNDITLNQRILNILAEGNIQLGKLAERLGVSAEDIKALDATTQDFHLGHAGWVKLGKKEGEA